MNPAAQLHELGQSLWLDSINRGMLRRGAPARYVDELAVTGLTSSPTILGHAMAAGTDYDGSHARLTQDGITDPQDPVYALALEDLGDAAELFHPVWEDTDGADGYVSAEVPPMWPTTRQRRSTWPGASTTKPASRTCWSRFPAPRPGWWTWRSRSPPASGST